MPEARARRLIHVPPERVFEYISDIANAPSWMFGVREVRGVRHRPVQEGDRLQIRLVAGGRLADSHWVIGSCEWPRRLSSSGQAMGATAQLEILCEPAGRGATAVSQRLAYQLPGGPLGLLAARFGIGGILELQANHSLQTLSSLLEAAPDHPAGEGGGRLLPHRE
ncbi:MAG: SRPBCC family protein [Candidatus Dormiibacterota bacterium]